MRHKPFDQIVAWERMGCFAHFFCILGTFGRRDHCLLGRAVSKSIIEGQIFLITKGGGDSKEVQKWRSIMISNLAQKILVKASSCSLC